MDPIVSARGVSHEPAVRSKGAGRAKDPIFHFPALLLKKRKQYDTMRQTVLRGKNETRVLLLGIAKCLLSLHVFFTPAQNQSRRAEKDRVCGHGLRRHRHYHQVFSVKMIV